MNRFQFSLIGCGNIAPTHARAIAALATEEAVLTTYHDIDAAKAESMAAEFDGQAASLEQILKDPEIDAISLCTPSGLHAEHAVTALLAGKHVIVEKPMEVSLERCDAMLAAQKNSGKVLAIIAQHRFDPASERVRTALDEGRLGRILYAEARIPWYRTQEYYDSGEWRGTWALDGGGCLMNQGIHTVDLLRWYCGPVKTVFAQTATAAHERIEVEDIVAATLTFENGLIGSLMASTATWPGYPARPSPFTGQRALPSLKATG